MTAAVTIEAFWTSVAHAKPLSVGINCALGAREMRPFLADLAAIAPCYMSSYPNAGLPNAFGAYDEQPATTGELIRETISSPHLYDKNQGGLIPILSPLAASKKISCRRWDDLPPSPASSFFVMCPPVRGRSLENSDPGLRLHDWPNQGQPQHVAEKILKSIFSL